jgi:tryptophan synthase alpha subunit
MNATNKLEKLMHGEKRPLFMTHLIAGYPSLPASEKVGRAMIAGGADILELQIPFSDPMADGPTIAAACQDALRAGASVAKTLALAKKLSSGETPVVIMSYINPIYRYGIAEFARDAARACATGLIIPDAPFDSPEGIKLLAETRKHGLCLIPVISPGVPIERLRYLSKHSRGFVYCTTRQGTTGANSKFAQTLAEYLASAKGEFNIPLGLGFGVKTRDDFRRAAKLADLVIAGSVFVNAIRSSRKGAETQAVKKAMADIRR